MSTSGETRVFKTLLDLWQRRGCTEVVKALCQGTQLNEEDQMLVLRLLDEDPLLQRYQPRPDYTRKLLKAVITHCEQHGEAIAEEVLCRYAAGVCVSQPAGPWTHRTYLHQHRAEADDMLPADLVQKHLVAATTSTQQAPSTPAHRGLVTLRVSDNMLAGGTGCHPWEAGFVLAELVLSHPHWFAGRRCLELGCGSGLVGVALHAAHGGSTAGGILLTDGDREALDNCCHNLELNGIDRASVASAEELGQDVWDKQAAVMHLDWTDAMPELQPDVILGADLLYDPEIVPSLVTLLKTMLLQAGTRASSATAGGDEATGPHQVASTAKMEPSRGGVAYLATKRRNERMLQLFLDRAAAAGLVLEDISKVAHNADVVFVQNACLQDRSSVLVHRISLPGA